MNKTMRKAVLGKTLSIKDERRNRAISWTPSLVELLVKAICHHLEDQDEDQQPHDIVIL